MGFLGGINSLLKWNCCWYNEVWCETGTRWPETRRTWLSCQIHILW